MKKILCLFIALMMFTSACAFADDDSSKITVNIDGETLNFDVEPIIENDRTLVPFRVIFEVLGCAVSYKAENGEQTVTARQGSKLICLVIGKPEIDVNGTVSQLDAAPKIIDGRTLVPLRAVSESLGCTVEWFGNTNTVSIHRNFGQYEVKTEFISKTVALDGGTPLMTIECTYPLVEPRVNSAFYDSINKEYLAEAENYISAIESEQTENAKLLYEAQGADYRPMAFSLTYDVTLNSNNMLSITLNDYQNANGAHPNTSRKSRTFQMQKNTELSLSEILGYETDEAALMIHDAFCGYFENFSVDIKEELSKNIDEEIKNIGWYLTDSALVMYFNPYQIGAYALGSPEVEFPCTYTDGDAKISLSGTSLDKLEFELSGNPTTGYSWETAVSEEGIIDVQSEYTSSDSTGTLAGAGGKYKFTVTGISQGTTTLSLSYLRPFEGSGSVIKTVTYKLRVSDDKKITVISRTEEDKTNDRENNSDDN